MYSLGSTRASFCKDPELEDLFQLYRDAWMPQQEADQAINDEEEEDQAEEEDSVEDEDEDEDDDDDDSSHGQNDDMGDDELREKLGLLKEVVTAEASEPEHVSEQSAPESQASKAEEALCHPRAALPEVTKALLPPEAPNPAPAMESKAAQFFDARTLRAERVARIALLKYPDGNHITLPRLF